MRGGLKADSRFSALSCPTLPCDWRFSQLPTLCSAQQRSSQLYHRHTSHSQMLSPTTLPPAQLGAAGSPSSARITRRWAPRTAVRVRAAEGTPLTGLLGGLWPSASAASPAAAAPSPTTAAAPEALPGIEEGPALTDVFAEPLPGDGEDVAALRQLLAQTQLEGAPLRLAYEANRDGWSADAFHAKVDGTGPALVVALTGEEAGGWPWPGSLLVAQPLQAVACMFT